MKKELKLGIFVICVIVVSFFVLNYLRGEDIFNREIDLSARYENVEGLVASAPVYIKGYKAGKVREVLYDPESGDFQVICSVSKDFKVPADSRMVIYGVDIMGTKGVRIDFGDSPELAADGQMLVPFVEAGLIDGLAAGVEPLMQKVSDTIDSLGVTVSAVNQLLSPVNQSRISGILHNVDRMLADLRSISSSIKGKSPELVALVENLSAFSSKLEGVAHEADSTLGSASRFVESLNESDIDGLVLSLKKLVDSLNDPNGTVGSLLVNDSVYNSVDSILIDVNQIVEKIKENPRKYFKISVF
jgi:phospholipid/cholesterol/gamma-HCH transport system substrate-binding protein